MGSRLICRSLLAMALLLPCALAPLMAGPLLTDTTFAPGTDQPALKAWRIDPTVGGSFKLTKDGETSLLTLNGERTFDPQGQQVHWGRLMQSGRLPIVPGRRYTMKIEARGDGHLTLGAVEFADKYSPRRVGTPEQRFPLTPQWQSFAFTFTPSDAAMYLSAFFQHEGWLGHADLRGPWLEEIVLPGAMTMTAGDFVYAHGEAITLQLSAEHPAVKLLVYGPGGVPPGPGGPFGGSDAWIDHFQMARDLQASAGTSSHTITLPKDARGGFYRAVAVDTVTGQTATASFSIYAPEVARQFRDLASRLTLPPESRLVFLGDSLTDFYRGRNYVDLVSRAIAVRNPKVQVINAGVGGNNAKNMLDRLEKDVIARQPTHVFIFEGANDSKRHFNPATGVTPRWALPVEEFEASYRQVVEQIGQKTGAQVIIMTTAPGDQRILEPFRQRARDFGRSMNFFCLPEEIARAAAIQTQIAQEFKLPVIDTRAHLQGLLDQNRTDEYLMVDDGVHLSEHGNREVALVVLQFLAKP